MVKTFLEMYSNSVGLKVILVCIVLDVIFGTLRAIREKKLNSCVGIDGMIRKIAMIISILSAIIIDAIVNVDLIGFIPVEIKSYYNVTKVGLSDLFNCLYIVFESISILKNMSKCKLPIPKKLQKILEKLLNEFTNELNEEEVKGDG